MATDPLEVEVECPFPHDPRRIKQDEICGFCGEWVYEQAGRNTVTLTGEAAAYLRYGRAASHPLLQTTLRNEAKSPVSQQEREVLRELRWADQALAEAAAQRVAAMKGATDDD